MEHPGNGPNPFFRLNTVCQSFEARRRPSGVYPANPALPPDKRRMSREDRAKLARPITRIVNAHSEMQRKQKHLREPLSLNMETSS